jgi:hypothetical protein
MWKRNDQIKIWGKETELKNIKEISNFNKDGINIVFCKKNNLKCYSKLFFDEIKTLRWISYLFRKI